MSYTKIGVFTLAGYPYSFKLLWSPIVDTLYFPSVGQRRSWILPLQLGSAFIMIQFSGWVEKMLFGGDAVAVTAYFFLLVLFAATQDIAVDGWALTLLSRKNVGYAATCQTIGMNIGYFSSFTIFLALNDPDFCASYLGMPKGGPPAVTLQQYLVLWGWVYVFVTLFVAFFKRERSIGVQPEAKDSSPAGAYAKEGGRRRSARLISRRQLSSIENGEDHHITATSEIDDIQTRDRSRKKAYKEIMDAYSQLWRTITLPSVRQLCMVLLLGRLAMLPTESVAALKLLEKGVSKETLAGLVLIEFPIELLSALVAGNWAAASHPLHPWLVGYRIRLLAAAGTTLCVAFFPSGVSTLYSAPLPFGALVVLGLITSFSSTLMFTSLGDFYNRISDTTMGGAYLTMLNTVANIGVVVPKVVIFALIDLFTFKKCVHLETDEEMPGSSCSTSGQATCEEQGGQCKIFHDGFYSVSIVACTFGLFLMLWLRRTLSSLERYPLSSWHASKKA